MSDAFETRPLLASASFCQERSPRSRTCVVLLPDFPLQILERRHPHWRGAPIAVVDDEGPNGRIVELNAIAARNHLHVGMRQTTALGLVPSLHTAVMPSADVAKIGADLVQSLQTFSPRVEHEPRFFGAFCIDPEGLRRLYGGYRVWATSILRYLRARRWRASIAIGFHRYRTFAIAHSTDRIRILKNVNEEREHSDAIPLSHFDLPAKLLEQLRALGVDTLGAFLSIPSGELKSRFGAESAQLHALFDSGTQLPIQPAVFEEAPCVSFQIDPPDSDVHRLLFAIKGALHSLITQVQARGEALKALQIDFHLERRAMHRECLEPARPMLDLMQLVELVRLRLSSMALQGEVEEVVLTALTERAVHEQTLLKGHEPKHDVRAAADALAKIRAAYGPRSVRKACVRDAHLPEASFRLAPIEKIAPSPPDNSPDATAMPLVRRVFSKPRPLPARTPKHPEAGPHLREDHKIEHLYGPYRVSGGWWKRLVERDYYYAQTDEGELLWLFFDRPRKRWFLHGIVD